MNTEVRNIALTVATGWIVAACLFTFPPAYNLMAKGFDNVMVAAYYLFLTGGL